MTHDKTRNRRPIFHGGGGGGVLRIFRPPRNAAISTSRTLDIRGNGNIFTSTASSGYVGSSRTLSLVSLGSLSSARFARQQCTRRDHLFLVRRRGCPAGFPRNCCGGFRWEGNRRGGPLKWSRCLRVAPQRLKKDIPPKQGIGGGVSVENGRSSNIFTNYRYY